jgi:hypothetical protein
VTRHPAVRDVLTARGEFELTTDIAWNAKKRLRDRKADLGEARRLANELVDVARTERDRLIDQHGPGHPSVVAAQRNLDDARRVRSDAEQAMRTRPARHPEGGGRDAA